MVYRKALKIEQLEINVFKSFEFKELFKGIYYPYCFYLSTANLSQECSHICLFFDEFSTLLEPVVYASGKLLLAGDLNFHVNNPSEGNAYQLLNVLSCFNLNALNVIIPIHKSNNLLDLITRSGKNNAFNLSVNDPVISKHSAVHCILDFERPSNKKVVLTSRKLSNMSTKHIKTV